MKKTKNDKHKCLCKLSKKEIEQNFKKISLLIIEAKFICGKCARSANTNNVLCSPQLI